MSKIIDYRHKTKNKPPPINCWRDVERIGLRSGLTAGTLQMLINRGFGSVKACRDITEDDLQVLPLYIGQQLAVSKLVDHLNSVLAGFDAETTEGKDTEDQAPTEASPSIQEEQEEEQEQGKEEQQALSDAQILMAKYYKQDEDEDEEEGGLVKLPAPHQFILGRASRKELSQEEFMYGNLLILEYFIEQRPSEVKASLAHIRFLILKLLNGYPLSSVIEYDAALRRKVERNQIRMPREADQDLVRKHIMMMAGRVDKKREKKKKVKGRGKTSKGREES